MKQCRYCGGSADLPKRYGHLCRSCKNQKHREWAAAHPGAQKRYQAATKAKDPDGVRERNRIAAARYRAADPDRAREISARHARDNRETVHESARRSRKKNYPKNKPRIVAHSRAREALKRGLVSADNPLNASGWTELLIAYGWCCAYCLNPLTEQDTTQDHVVPLCRGGEHSSRNVVPACRPCNLRKGVKLLSEWPVAA